MGRADVVQGIERLLGGDIITTGSRLHFEVGARGGRHTDRGMMRWRVLRKQSTTPIRWA